MIKKKFLRILFTTLALPLLISLVAVLVTVFTLVPRPALATDVYEKVLTKNEVWLAKNSPYYIYGKVSVLDGISLTIERGSQLFVQDGGFDVLGNLYIKGTLQNPVQIELNPAYSAYSTNSGYSAFTSRGGTLDFDYVKVSGGSGFIDAYNKSSVILINSTVSNLSSSASTVSVWKDSSLTISDTDFLNIQSPHVLDIWGGTSASIANSTLDSSARLSAIEVYGSGELVTTANIENVTINKGKVGLEVFDDALVKVSDSTFKNVLSSGVLIHSGATVDIEKSNFINNEIGVEGYDASSTISQSSFEGNKQVGAMFYRGKFYSSNNWWGSAKGPIYEPVAGGTATQGTAIQGDGDKVEGDTNPAPWLQEKPQNTRCCSSVLFIPGMEGSRFYKSSRFGENQLWEPNRNADVKNLYLSVDGKPLDTTLYNRDIILRTNIGLGRYDKDVYSDFSFYLNKTESAFSIRDWQYAVYDWRLFPTDIVRSGSRVKTDSKALNVSIKKMQDQIESMASISKTKKVTIVAHSYGGLVAKSLLEQLSRAGKLSLVDKVILVAVPEQGSVDAMVALLHGDNQDIGRGYILNKSTARSLALNMPTAYMVLPDSDLLASLSNIPIIKFATTKWFGNAGASTANTQPSTVLPSVTEPIYDMSRLTNFLKAQNFMRPVSTNSEDIIFPAKINADLYSKSIEEKYRNNVNFAQSVFGGSASDGLADSNPSDIQIFNIVGVGRKTLRGISYVEKECMAIDENKYFINSQLTSAIASVFTSPAPVPENCGFDHVPIYSSLGDGSVPIGSITKRIGKKIIFDIGLYNFDKNKNINHMDIMGAEPVLNTIGQILFNKFGVYNAPSHMTVYGDGSGNNVGANTSASTVETNHKVNTVQFTLSEGMDMQAINSMGMISGYYAPFLNTISTISTSTIKTTKITRDIGSAKINITNEIPNSSYGSIGGGTYLLTEAMPKNLIVMPTHLSEDTTSFSLDVKNIRDDSGGVYDSTDSAYSNLEGDPLFRFEDIPIEQGALVTVEILNGSSAPAVMKVDNSANDGVSDIKIYSPSLPDSVTGKYTNGGHDIYNTQQNIFSSTTTSTSTNMSTTTVAVDFLNVLQKVRTEILASAVRKNFKQRYLSRIDKIKKYYVAGKIRGYADVLTIMTANSLELINRELKKKRFRLYSGGMNLSEASFLSARFAELKKVW